MLNSLLFLITTIIWGTTWIAINWQLGDADILISIFYRFAIAGIIFLPLLFLCGKLQATKPFDHLFFGLQGVCLFSLNFICFYTASQYIVSGLISVIFASAILFNAFNQWIFWLKKPKPSIYYAATLGIVGLLLLFWNQIHVSQNMNEIIYGMSYSFLGTYLFSLGNMISVRNSKKGIRPWTSNAYGMIYGTLFLLFIIIVFNISWVWDERPIYLASLIYLAIPGSILGFTIYLILVGRIGANQAAFVTVLFPIVALSISTLAEGYTWDYFAVLGLAFIIIGVLLATKGKKLFSPFLLLSHFKLNARPHKDKK